jgi:hypothetical protein
LKNQVHTPIHVFPNPNRGGLTLGGDILGDVEVLDVTGRILGEINQTNQINIVNFLPGVYYLKVQTENSCSIQKVIKL